MEKVTSEQHIEKNHENDKVNENKYDPQLSYIIFQLQKLSSKDLSIVERFLEIFFLENLSPKDLLIVERFLEIFFLEKIKENK